MTMIYRVDKETNNIFILVQNRLKNDWPGLNFPGGHVKSDESLEESAVREIKEETNLEVKNLEFVNVFEWNVVEKETRHLAILYRSNDYDGELKNSNEGNMLWINLKDVNKYPLSTDFDKLISIMTKNL